MKHFRSDSCPVELSYALMTFTSYYFQHFIYEVIFCHFSISFFLLHDCGLTESSCVKFRDLFPSHLEIIKFHSKLIYYVHYLVTCGCKEMFFFFALIFIFAYIHSLETCKRWCHQKIHPECSTTDNFQLILQIINIRCCALILCGEHFLELED